MTASEPRDVPFTIRGRYMDGVCELTTICFECQASFGVTSDTQTRAFLRMDDLLAEHIRERHGEVFR